MIRFYDYDGNVITQEQWEALFAGSRTVAFTEIGDVDVSTIFEGLDHSFGFGGPPLIFETMVFGGDLDGTQARYPNRLAALAGHDQIVAEVRDVESLNLPPQPRHEAT